MSEKLVNRIFAAIALLYSFVVYFLTMAPTVSFWDCGEFIASSYKLAVPHPPGAPLYLLVGRLFSLLPIFADIGRRVNFISVISSGLTVMFLYLIIVHFIKEFMARGEEFSRYIPYIGALIGALSFAFSNSFWFNAVEAEVYAPSMLFTSMVVWLILRWSERSNEIGNEKYLIFIPYLIGLAIGVHLLNVLTLPMVVLIIFYKKYEVNFTNLIYAGLVGVLVTALVYPGVVKGVPNIAEWVGFFGLGVLILVGLFLLSWTVKNHKNLSAILLTGLLLVVLGYSSYMMIYIRSGLNPNIDENDPETIERFISYLNREQYGKQTSDRYQTWQDSPNKDRYSSTLDFFWNYQINKMYIRYFEWNFIGRSSNGRDVDYVKFFFIPFLLGMVGAFSHFRRDWKHALAVFALFFMTGLAIILYLNQPDPQPRERDYSYVGSFFAFAIWIGIGAAVILEWVEKNTRNLGPALPAIVAVFLFLGSPVLMMARNFHEQNRTGNYVAWDYSYNMLISVEPNGVLFTNGDNDTFPLWYLQEVENIRTDVRVANLSLINTSWYIKQLKHNAPKVPISLSDEEIDQIGPIPWPKKRRFELEVPAKVAQIETRDYQKSFSVGNLTPPKKISFELGPKIFGRYLRTQDLMILNILATNKFRRPLYFGVTVAGENMLDGLQQYLRMDGSVMKITTVKNWQIGVKELEENLLTKFRYRNLNNPKVFFNNNIIGLLQNYRSAFINLAEYYLTRNNLAKFKEIVKKEKEIMPPSVIPYTNRSIRLRMTAHEFLAGERSLDSLNARNYSLNEMQKLGEIWAYLRQWRYASAALEKALKLNPEDPRTQGFLINIYDQTGEIEKAAELLKKWIAKRPNDQSAKQRLAQYEKILKKKKK